MKALLKALGIGREVGTEDEAQALWLETLGKLGYKAQQAFPDNMECLCIVELKEC